MGGIFVDGTGDVFGTIPEGENNNHYTTMDEG